MSKNICKILLPIIFLYQKLISPLLPRSCRYYPTCSAFAKEHLMKNTNIFIAFYEIFKRISRCNQFFEGGFDYPKIKKQFDINIFKINNQLMNFKYFYVKIDKKNYVLIKAI